MFQEKDWIASHITENVKNFFPSKWRGKSNKGQSFIANLLYPVFVIAQVAASR